MVHTRGAKSGDTKPQTVTTTKYQLTSGKRNWTACIGQGLLKVMLKNTQEMQLEVDRRNPPQSDQTEESFLLSAPMLPACCDKQPGQDPVRSNK